MENLIISLREYLSPELVYMIPILIVIGSVPKKSNRVSSTLIPTILSKLGIPIALVVSLASKYDPMTPYQIVVWFLMGIGQGIQQFFKQHTECKNLKTWEEKENIIKEIKESMEAENEHK